MIKKLLFVSLLISIFIISCSDGNNEINTTKDSVTKSETLNKTSASAYSTFPVMLGAGDFPPTEGNITVNTNYVYYSDFNVYAGDENYSTPTPNCLGDGKPCLNLSHFLGRYGAWSKDPAYDPATIARYPIFYGENGEYDYRRYPLPAGVNGGDTEQSFVVRETGSSSPLFNNTGYMTSDAANSVLHYFKDMMATLPATNSQGKTFKLLAVHIKYGAWFTIPAHRDCKMSVRYYYN